MFFGSPLPQPAPQKSPAEQALSTMRQALKEECQNHPTLFLMETKKLYLTLLESYEMQGRARAQGLQTRPEDLLASELRNQLLAFALMQCLPEGVCKQAALQAQHLSQADRTRTRSAFLVEELEKHLEVTDEVEQKVSRWLMLQPLFRLNNQRPELFAELANHFSEVARRIPDLLRTTNESLVTLMKTAPPT